MKLSPRVQGWSERENLTLSDAELERWDLSAGEGVRTLRAFIPFPTGNFRAPSAINGVSTSCFGLVYPETFP